LIPRILELVPTAMRQVVPLNGIFGRDWQPASAIAVYWAESVLLAAIAVVLCLRLKQRISHRAIADARTAGDLEYAAAIEAEQPELVNAWRAYNLQIAALMRASPDAELNRPRTRHTLHEIGFQPLPDGLDATLGFLMRDYIVHLQHHVKQVLAE